MKHALIAASLVLVAGTVAGCGGNTSSSSSSSSSTPTGPPTNATTSTFCGTFKTIGQDVSKLDANAKDADVVKALKKAGSELAAVGTPKDAPADARTGFEITVKLIKGLPDNATKAQIGTIDDKLSKTEKAQEDAFNSYVTKTCKV
jgi:predicted small secreted protein